jgi:hypothetical protein
LVDRRGALSVPNGAVANLCGSTLDGFEFTFTGPPAVGPVTSEDRYVVVHVGRRVGCTVP